jgi:hypothetical protein
VPFVSLSLTVFFWVVYSVSVPEIDLFGNPIFEERPQAKSEKPVKKPELACWDGVMRPYVVIKESPTFTTILNR